MKKIKISRKKVLILAAVIIVLGLLGRLVNRVYQVKKFVNEQNYIASKLIEQGEYTKGSILAIQSEQIKKNETSEALITLAAGLNTDYDIALLYAEQYLQETDLEQVQKVKTAVLKHQEAMQALQEAEVYDQEAFQKLEETTYNSFLILLLQIQEEIPVKKSDETLAAITNYMTGHTSGSVAMEQIASDSSLLAKSVQAEYALDKGDYETAFAQMENLIDADVSFEYKAKLANMAVNTGYNTVDDNDTMQLQKELSELNQDLYTLYDTLNQELNNIKRGELENRIQNLEMEIQLLETQIQSIPAKKALNYIQTAATYAEKSSTAYQLEVAQLYYMADEREQAEAVLRKLTLEEKDSMEAANILWKNFKNCYLDKESSQMQKLWEQLAALLGLEAGSSYYYQYRSESSFYQFVQNIFEDIYNGLIIREINTTDYPDVKVTFNASIELDQTLKKTMLSLFDKEVEVSKFTLIPAQEVENNTQMSVELVVDISGSMDGTPLEDTKKAVNNFIQNLDTDIQVGVVAFDHEAYVIAPISRDHTTAVREVNGLYAMGGTSIYSGLAMAAEQLENTSGRKIIILMSDGEDASYIDELLEELNRKNIIVYTIGFGGTNVEYLSNIATTCGGKFIYADTSDMLSEIYAAVGSYMVNDYILEFTAETDIDDFDRILKIVLDQEGVFAEKTYYIGVTPEEIAAEAGRRPQADYFQEVGGSDKSMHE